MTAIEEWATTVAAALAKEPEHAEGCPAAGSLGCRECKGDGEVAGFDPHVAVPCPTCRPNDQREGWERCRCGFHPSTLEQRLAIGLLEARAVECRYWGNKMLEKFIGRSDLPALVVQFAVFLSKKFFERETKLGKVGLAMCTTWPPNTPAETLVVDKEWDIQ